MQFSKYVVFSSPTCIVEKLASCIKNTFKFIKLHCCIVELWCGKRIPAVWHNTIVLFQTAPIFQRWWIWSRGWHFIAERDIVRNDFQIQQTIPKRWQAARPLVCSYSRAAEHTELPLKCSSSATMWSAQMQIALPSSWLYEPEWLSKSSNYTTMLGSCAAPKTAPAGLCQITRCCNWKRCSSANMWFFKSHVHCREADFLHQKDVQIHQAILLHCGAVMRQTHPCSLTWH